MNNIERYLYYEGDEITFVRKFIGDDIVLQFDIEFFSYSDPLVIIKTKWPSKRMSYNDFSQTQYGWVAGDRRQIMTLLIKAMYKLAEKNEFKIHLSLL